MEVQNQYRILARDYSALQKEAKIKVHESKLLTLTNRELESLKDGTHVYKAVGKMFMKSTKPDLRHELVSAESASRKEISTLESRLKSLEAKQKEVEERMREIVEHHAILA